MRPSRLFALAATAIFALSGCHSAFIEATLSNHTSVPLSLIEVDYPSASFGTQTLAPNANFHYPFKVLGSGPTTLLWTDPAHQEHKSPGPTLHESDEGRLTITFNPTGPSWEIHLLNRKTE